MRRFSKYRISICTALIVAGLSILVWQSVQHFRSASRGTLKPFDEDGEPVAVPFLGLVCLGSGVFLLVLTSRRE